MAGLMPTEPSRNRRTVTRLLALWGQGDQEADAQLAELVYAELTALAASYLRRERTGQTLDTAALVHEAYLRLVDQSVSWQSRSHFYGVAALMMRRLLVEQARGRRLARRGGGALHVSAESLTALAVPQPPEVAAIAEAIDQLKVRFPQAARIVELRFFAGLSELDVAAVLGLSVPTVKRRWRLARAWLHRYLESS